MQLSCRVRRYSEDIVTEEKMSVLIRRNKSDTLLFLIKCRFPRGFGCEHCNIVILQGRLNHGTIQRTMADAYFVRGFSPDKGVAFRRRSLMMFSRRLILIK